MLELQCYRSDILEQSSWLVANTLTLPVASNLWLNVDADGLLQSRNRLSCPHVGVVVHLSNIRSA